MYRIDEIEPQEGNEVTPKADTTDYHHCTGPGTKEAPGEEMVPCYSSTAGDLPLSEDHGSLHPQGFICVVNKIHELHVEDIEDMLY